MYGARGLSTRGSTPATLGSRPSTAASEAPASLYERPPWYKRFTRPPKLGGNPGWGVVAFAAFAVLGLTGALWAYPQIARAVDGETRAFNSCLVVGGDASTGCVLVRTLHAPERTQCVYDLRPAARAAGAAGDTLRAAFVGVHPVGIELPCFHEVAPPGAPADAPLALQLEGTSSTTGAYMSLLVLLIPLLCCCYATHRSLGPLLPPKVSRVEDEILPWIVRATENGADAAASAAEVRMESGLRPLQEQLRYEKERRLELEANMDKVRAAVRTRMTERARRVDACSRACARTRAS